MVCLIFANTPKRKLDKMNIMECIGIFRNGHMDKYETTYSRISKMVKSNSGLHQKICRFQMRDLIEKTIHSKCKAKC